MTCKTCINEYSWYSDRSQYGRILYCLEIALSEARRKKSYVNIRWMLEDGNLLAKDLLVINDLPYGNRFLNGGYSLRAKELVTLINAFKEGYDATT